MPSSEIDRLFDAPLEEFVTKRDALAKSLRKEGRRDEAAEIAALRKPVAAAWVVNRLARAERAKIRALIRATEAVKTGRKGGDGRFREAVDELTRAARGVLDGAGKRPTDTVLRDVSATLRAAAVAAPNLLAAGRLETLMEPSGFEAMAGAALRRPPTARSATRDSARSARVEAARKEVAKAKAAARRLRSSAEEALREAERTLAAAEKAETTLAKAEARLEKARGH